MQIFISEFLAFQRSLFWKSHWPRYQHHQLGHYFTPLWPKTAYHRCSFNFCHSFTAWAFFPPKRWQRTKDSLSEPPSDYAMTVEEKTSFPETHSMIPLQSPSYTKDSTSKWGQPRQHNGFALFTATHSPTPFSLSPLKGPLQRNAPKQLFTISSLISVARLLIWAVVSALSVPFRQLQ